MFPLLREVLGGFAAELEAGLRREHHDVLALQVTGLRIVDRCRCGDQFCAMVYTEPRPDGAYGEGFRNLEVPGMRGLVVLDLVHDRIHAVEILHRPDVRALLLAALP